MADYTLTNEADVFPTGQDTSGDDRIYGLAGDDILTGGAGADLLDGGDGFDTVTYAASTVAVFINPWSRVPRNDGTGDTFVSIERFLLSGFNDYFRADQSFTAGIEVQGGAGNDSVYATAFADTLLGGLGDDDLRGGDGDDEVRGGAGNDLIHGDGGRDRMFGDAGDDLIYAGTNNDLIDGGEGFDTVMLFGDPTQYELSLRADGAVQILHLTPEYEDAGRTTLIGAIDILTNVERLRYYDGTVFDLAAWIDANSTPAGFNAIRGTVESDILAGTDGKDAIYGLAGNDTLSGGAGDDLLSGGGGADAFDGGEGIDTVTYRNSSGPILVNVPRPPFSTEDPTHEAFGDTFAGVERVELTAFDDVLYWIAETGVEVFGHAGKDSIVGGAGGDTLDGGAADDFLYGADGDDNLRGGDGDDRLDGGDGDDLLDGGLGRDSIYGGFGTDTLTFEGRTSGVSIGFSPVPSEDAIYYSIEIFRLTEFNDRIRLYASFNDDGNAGFSDVYAGAGDDIVDGSILAGKLYGEDGNDILTAGHYGSLLDGGAGDDILHSAWGGDMIIGGEGTDTVHFTRPRGEYHIERDGDALLVAHISSGWVDRLTGVEFLSFPDPVFLDRLVIDVSTFASVDVATPLQVGSVGADAMVGVAKSTNAFFGLAGGDTMTGGDQADMLSGGDDDDLLVGGAGDDSLYGGNGVDRLDGGSGADKMAGGTGDDFYEVDDMGDTVTELTGEGVDEVRTALGSRGDYSLIYVLPDHVEKLTGTSATGQGVQANALDNVVAMGAGDDLVVLDGGGNDTVTAGAGNDFLYYGGALTNGDSNNGGAGHDTLGLLGTYRLAFDADDLVSIEKLAVYGSGNAAAPNDYDLTTHDRNVAAGETLTVIALSLAAGETLRFNGAAETDGTFAIYSGKDSDTITGGAGNDTIYGNLGADTLKGGGGNDVFVYQSAAESRLGAADVILDFSRGDRINLTAIDADGNAANGNTAFAWLGTDAFTGQAGQLRVSRHPQHDRAWLVEGDTDGDGAADFLLYLVAEPGLVPQQGDFWL